MNNSRINSYSQCKKTNSGDNNNVWLGGICGKNHKTIIYSTTSNNTFYIEVRGDGKLGNKAYPVGYLGGIVGEQASGEIEYCTASGNTLSSYLSEGTYTDPKLNKGNVCGKQTGGTIG